MRRCCRTLGEPGLDLAWSCALLCYLLLVSKHAVSTHLHTHMLVSHTNSSIPISMLVFTTGTDTGRAAKQPTLLSPLPHDQQNQGVDVGGKAQPPCLHGGLWLIQACIDLFFRMCTKQDSVKLPGLHQSSCAMSGNKYHSPICAQPGLLLRTPSMRVSGCLGD